MPRALVYAVTCAGERHGAQCVVCGVGCLPRYPPGGAHGGGQGYRLGVAGGVNFELDCTARQIHYAARPCNVVEICTERQNYGLTCCSMMLGKMATYEYVIL